MRSIALTLLLVCANTLAFAQTMQLRAGVPISAGQCVAFAQGNAAGGAVLCNNTLPVPPPVIGVALNTVTTPGTLVTVQYAGLVTLPVTTTDSLTPAEFIGDADGTGNLNTLGFDWCSCNGIQTYAGIFVGYTNAHLTSFEMIVQPGYIPTSTGTVNPEIKSNHDHK